MNFIKISDTKKHLTTNEGNPFFVMGANYEGYFDRAWHMWDNGKFDPVLIGHDFEKMANTGLNVVRLFVQPALENDIRANKFSKLDLVLQLAADHHLSVLLSLNDAHGLNLSAASQIDVKIAQHYRDDPVILGYDLENEPVFYNFVAAIYPPEHPAPVHSNVLIEHYGERVSRQEAIDLQQQRRIPGHLSHEIAYYYINALRLFIEFHDEGTTWANQNNATLVEYIYRNDSEKWHKLVETLNGTVDAWLAIRHAPIRAADPNHLTTVGYNWLHFAALPANQQLGFQSYHKYGGASLSKLRETTRALDSLQAAFPNHPHLLSEFGYTNQSSSTPGASQPIDENLTALFELGLLSHLRANNFAGGLKWMLNDVDTPDNPYEASFGIYRVGDHPKPVQKLLKMAQQMWNIPLAAGKISTVQDAVGMAFRMDLDKAILLAGGTFQDESLSWQADSIGYCQIYLNDDDSLNIVGQGTGKLTLSPQAIVQNWDSTRHNLLSQKLGDEWVLKKNFSPDEPVQWGINLGETYRLAMAELPADPPPADEIPEPNPGEHVVLLGNADDIFRAAMPYIRHFSPDITFATDEVAGRWLYVSVLASEAQVSNDVIDAIKTEGAIFIERIADNLETILADLVAKNQRFLNADPVLPPEPPAPPEDPTPPDDPTPPPPPPPNPDVIYTVQPGDSLYRIAREFYGNGNLWHAIFDANRDVLDTPSLIRPGMQLKIPNLEG